MVEAVNTNADVKTEQGKKMNTLNITYFYNICLERQTINMNSITLHYIVHTQF